ncbi:hypothetical protein V8G54_012008 [Vigna mungo]|uniref:Uncharacterized protein n=1 Tax=Vigna mungo TaxID=3915 RepID=A0AAQ3NSN1_VIGMU
MVVFFKSHLLTDNKRRVAKRQVWQLNDYQAYFRQDLVRLHDLLSADWVNAAPKWVLGAKMDAITGFCNRLRRGCKRLPGQYMDSVLNLDAAPKWVLGANMDAITGSLNAAPKWVLGAKMDAITGFCNRLRRGCKRLPGQYMDSVLNLDAAPKWVFGAKMDAITGFCNRLRRGCKRLPGQYMDSVLNLDAAPKWVLVAKMDAITWSLSTRVGSFEMLCHFHMQLGFVIAYGEDVSDYQVATTYNGAQNPQDMEYASQTIQTSELSEFAPNGFMFSTRRHEWKEELLSPTAPLQLIITVTYIAH